MELFNKLFGNQENDEKIYSPVNGDIISLATVKDKVFSTKAMGDGVGIIPQDGIVYSPFDGEVAAIFPTNHAIGLVNDKGVEILIHIGIDTVELNGEGFQSFVKQGDKVKAHDKLITFDLNKISKDYDTTVMVIVTDTNGIDLQIPESRTISKEDIIFKK